MVSVTRNDSSAAFDVTASQKACLPGNRGEWQQYDHRQPQRRDTDPQGRAAAAAAVRPRRLACAITRRLVEFGLDRLGIGAFTQKRSGHPVAFV
jgi:hypothetical protein